MILSTSWKFDFPFYSPIIHYVSYLMSHDSIPILQVQAIEWPFSDSSANNGANGGRVKGGNEVEMHSIADYLSKQKIDLVINLPLRQRRQTAFVTKGYITRRMAVEYSVPLITDNKCAKLLVKVRVCV